LTRQGPSTLREEKFFPTATKMIEAATAGSTIALGVTTTRKAAANA
jgi:hypothetical protein